jgi:hypothetical protein
VRALVLDAQEECRAKLRCPILRESFRFVPTKSAQRNKLHILAHPNRTCMLGPAALIPIILDEVESLLSSIAHVARFE